MKDQLLQEFIEKGADIEHTRWSGWQEYLHSKCTKNEDGSLTIPAYSVERWERQIVTPYSELSEQEKESDRHEVRKYLPLLLHTIEEAMRERDGELKSKLNKLIQQELDSIKVKPVDFPQKPSEGAEGYYTGHQQALETLLPKILALLGESKEGIQDGEECCNECGHHDSFCIPSCYPTHCHFNRCKCHKK